MIKKHTIPAMIDAKRWAEGRNAGFWKRVLKLVTNWSHLTLDFFWDMPIIVVRAHKKAHRTFKKKMTPEIDRKDMKNRSISPLTIS